MNRSANHYSWRWWPGYLCVCALTLADTWAAWFAILILKFEGFSLARMAVGPSCCVWRVSGWESVNMHITMMKGIIGYFCGFMDYVWSVPPRVCLAFCQLGIFFGWDCLATFVSLFGQPTTQAAPHVFHNDFLLFAATVHPSSTVCLSVLLWCFSAKAMRCDEGVILLTLWLGISVWILNWPNWAKNKRKENMFSISRGNFLTSGWNSKCQQYGWLPKGCNLLWKFCAGIL